MLLFSNSLSGTVSAISIPGLNALTLHGNRFEGDAPDLSSLGSLRYLTLFENEFTGTHTHTYVYAWLIYVSIQFTDMQRHFIAQFLSLQIEAERQ